jgi:glutamate--cysteine ligase
VPIAVVAALIEDPLAAEVAAEATEPAADRWREAARQGLTDPVLARAARRCFEAARDALPRLGASALVPLVDDYAERFVARGRCPADGADEKPLDVTPGGPGARVPAGKEERWM